MRKTLLLLLLFSLYQPSLAQTNQHLFFTSVQGVFRASLDDLQPHPLAEVLVVSPRYMAFDSLNQKLYWSDGWTGKIMRADADGSNPENVVTLGIRPPAGIALDVDDGKIYWVEQDFGIVWRANLDGSNPEEIYRGISSTSGIAIDTQAKQLFVVGSEFGMDMVVRMSTDGSDPEQILSHSNGVFSLLNVRDLEVDPEAGKLYLASGSRIYRTNLDGSTPEVLVEDRDHLVGFGLSLQERKMYWVINTGDGPEFIRRANLDGSEVEDVLSEGLGSPLGLAVDGKNGKLFWQNTSGLQLVKANTDGSNIETILQTEHVLPRDIDWDGSRNQVYWSDQGIDKILRADAFTGMVDTVATRQTGLGWPSGSPYPHGVAVDAENGKVYWTALNGNVIHYVIQKADLDGSNVENVVTYQEDLGAARDLAFDLPRRTMYWTEGNIRMASMDGGPITDFSATQNGGVGGLAIDPLGEKIYWSSDEGFQNSNIRRANLDGSGVEDLLTEQQQSMGGIALDLDAQKMYWTEWDRNRIQRANFDGTEVETVLNVFRPLWIAIGSAAVRAGTDSESEKFPLEIRNYPNPFLNTLTLEYTLNAPQYTSIAVHDVLGRELAVLERAWKPAGMHAIEWDAEGMPAGLYLVVITKGNGEKLVRSVIKVD